MGMQFAGEATSLRSTDECNICRASFCRGHGRRRTGALLRVDEHRPRLLAGSLGRFALSTQHSPYLRTAKGLLAAGRESRGPRYVHLTGRRGVTLASALAASEDQSSVDAVGPAQSTTSRRVSPGFSYFSTQIRKVRRGKVEKQCAGRRAMHHQSRKAAHTVWSSSSDPSISRSSTRQKRRMSRQTSFEVI